MAVTLLALVLVAIPAVAVVFGTAALALIVRWLSGATIRGGSWAFIGSAMPVLMASYGLYLVSPWPWRAPEYAVDGFPPGPLLLIAAPPSWALCFLTSRLILRRRPV